jgi:hypothetical protein
VARTVGSNAISLPNNKTVAPALNRTVATMRPPMKDDDAVFVMANGGDLTMRWTDPRHLVLTYPGWADVTRGCRMARGVSITYAARPTPDSAWRAWAHDE